MDNPLLKSVLSKYPDVDAGSLPWPADADSWEAKDLDLFIGSGGFLKPKKKKEKAQEQVKPPTAPPRPQVENCSAGYPIATEAQSEAKGEDRTEKSEGTEARGPQSQSPSPCPAAAKAEGTASLTSAGTALFANEGEAQEVTSAFDSPGFSKERFAITMPVRVHCEDTTPFGHVRLESLTAYSERIRSLALKQIMNVSLADLKEQKLAILATEFVVEIVGQGIRVLDTLRLDTTTEFPCAPLFPWNFTMTADDGSLYAQGRFGLNLCQISESGAYSGVGETAYKKFASNFEKWIDPKASSFTPTTLRFFNRYKASGRPFKPTSRKEVSYTVRASDCDLYNVLFQARVPSMMQSCHPEHNAMAMYVNIRMSVRPGDELKVHVFSSSDEAFFLCIKDKTAVLTAFGHYNTIRPMGTEGIKCASVRIPLLMKYVSGEPAPKPCEDFDFSLL